jgi:hypothetical protein
VVPRPKSELTNGGKMVGIRMTKSQYEHWKLMGGAVWLRQQLAMGIEVRRKYEQALKKVSK